MIYTVKRIDEDLDFGCEEKVWDKAKKARDVAIGVVILIVIGIAQTWTKDGQKQIIKAKVNVGEDIIKAIIKT